MPTYAVAILLGCLLQTQQAALWTRELYGAALTAGLVGTFGLLLWHSMASVQPLRSNAARLGQGAAVAASGFALAFGLAGWRAHPLLADRLAPDLETQVLQVEGVVVGLPVLYADATRFEFDVHQPAPPGVPQRLSLSWYAVRSKTGEPAPPPRVHPGEVWRLSVRLKRPHGYSNPGGGDTELALFRDGFGATGTVSRAGGRGMPGGGSGPLLLSRRSDPGDWLAQLRDRLRQRMMAALQDHPAAGPPQGGLSPLGGQGGQGPSVGAVHPAAGPPQGGVSPLGGQGGQGPSVGAIHPAAGTIIALALGDQAAISPADWTTYRITGVAHLMSISGLHITLLAWLALRVVDWAWRQTARLRRPWTLYLPAPTVAAWAALVAATAYAMLAGWGVPAQRTLLMLAVVLVLRQRGLRTYWLDVMALALIAVLLWDPWAVRQAGFWLSFVAVGMLFVAGERKQSATSVLASDTAVLPRGTAAPRPGILHRSWQKLRAAGHAQWVATIALAPLTLLFFQQIALLSPLSNALAIPLVTLLVAPLAVAGLLLPAPLDAWAWQLAALVQQGLDGVLRLLAAWPLAQWHAAAPDAISLLLAAFGVLALTLPWGWRLRLPGLLLLLPLASNPGTRPAPGETEVWFADVGQGMAVVVRTAHHTLLYDTGPQQAPGMLRAPLASGLPGGVGAPTLAAGAAALPPEGAHPALGRPGGGVDAGERIVLPLLHSLGERRLDRVVVSHDDSDHAGGAAAIARAHPEASLLTSMPLESAARFGFVRVQTCVAGQRWTWDGVEFRIVGPLPDKPVHSDNAASCVLHVAARGASVLLTGDIDARQEQALHAAGNLPYADVLLVPHHGSKTSSSDALIDTVMPRAAVVQAGYRNPHRHPHPLVVARYSQRGIALWRTDLQGALLWRDAAPDTLQGWRARHPRYWHAGLESNGDPSGVD